MTKFIHMVGLNTSTNEQYGLIEDLLRCKYGLTTHQDDNLVAFTKLGYRISNNQNLWRVNMLGKSRAGLVFATPEFGDIESEEVYKINFKYYSDMISDKVKKEDPMKKAVREIYDKLYPDVTFHSMFCQNALEYFSH